MEDKEFKFESETNENNVSTDTEQAKSGEDVEVQKDINVDSRETETKKQSSKENSRFAEMRRRNEAKAHEVNVEQEAYVKGKIDALKINTFTNKEIKSKRDLEIFEAMKKAEEEGRNDPTIDGYDIYFNNLDKAEEERLLKIKEEESKTDLMRKQLEQLKVAIPDEVERTNLLNDNDFKDLYEDTIERGGDLGKAALAYRRIRERAMQDAKLTYEAKKQSQSAPSQNGSQRQKTSVNDMTDKEIDELFKKRFGGY